MRKKKDIYQFFLNLQTSEGTVCNVCISSFTLYQHFRSKTGILGKYSLFHQSCMLSFLFLLRLGLTFLKKPFAQCFATTKFSTTSASATAPIGSRTKSCCRWLVRTSTCCAWTCAAAFTWAGTRWWPCLWAARGCSTMSLAHCEWVDSLALRSLADHCSDLRSLDVTACRQLKDDAVCYLAGKCPALRSLSVAVNANITDTAVEEVAKKCRELERLDLTGCLRVRNEAIRCAVFVLKLKSD